MKCLDSSEIYRFVLGELDAEQAAALTLHLKSCERCATEHAQVQQLLEGLAPDEGEFSDQRFAGDVMTLIQLGQARRQELQLPRPRRAERWRHWFAIPITAVATAALLAVFWLRVEPPPSGQQPAFQSRGGAASEDAWVSIRAYVAAAGRYLPVTDKIQANDAVAFTFTNRAPAPYRYLMIFAVDQTGQVFWYYPEHLTAQENPQSIAIELSDQPQQLAEQVRHAFAPGKLRLFGLFSQHPLELQAVEGLVARQLRQVGALEKLRRLPLPHTGQQSILLQVLPAAGGEEKR